MIADCQTLSERQRVEDSIGKLSLVPLILLFKLLEMIHNGRGAAYLRGAAAESALTNQISCINQGATTKFGT